MSLPDDRERDSDFLAALTRVTYTMCFHIKNWFFYVRSKRPPAIDYLMAEARRSYRAH